MRLCNCAEQMQQQPCQQPPIPPKHAHRRCLGGMGAGGPMGTRADAGAATPAPGSPAAASGLFSSPGREGGGGGGTGMRRGGAAGWARPARAGCCCACCNFTLPAPSIWTWRAGAAGRGGEALQAERAGRIPRSGSQTVQGGQRRTPLPIHSHTTASRPQTTARSPALPCPALLHSLHPAHLAGAAGWDRGLVASGSSSAAAPGLAAPTAGGGRATGRVGASSSSPSPSCEPRDVLVSLGPTTAPSAFITICVPTAPARGERALTPHSWKGGVQMLRSCPARMHAVGWPSATHSRSK